MDWGETMQNRSIDTEKGILAREPARVKVEPSRLIDRPVGRQTSCRSSTKNHMSTFYINFSQFPLTILVAKMSNVDIASSQTAASVVVRTSEVANDIVSTR